MSSSNCDAIQRHIDRQARGRRQRFDKNRDEREGRILIFGVQSGDCFDQLLKTHQRNVAERMLEDFHSSGVDEDLELLKAGWANHFKARPGRPQPQRPLLADLQPTQPTVEDIDSEPRSLLAAQGERAKQRLQGLEQLRHLAGEGAGTQQSNCFSTRLGGAGLRKFPFEMPSAPGNGPLQHVGQLVHGIVHGSDGKGKRTSDCLQETQSGFARETRDLWAEWEARWSQEFRRLDELERNRRRQLMATAEAAWAQREQQWHQRVHAREADAFAHNARTKARGESKNQKPRTTTKEAPKSPTEPSRPSRPSRPPIQPDQSQQSTFRSFADFSAAWSTFEKKVSDIGSGSKLLVSDIPWPDGLVSVSGISGDTAAEAKKKLRTALLRWHPDKWAPILEHVAEADRAEVIARVKLVTQRLLEEKRAQDPR